LVHRTTLTQTFDAYIKFNFELNLRSAFFIQSSSCCCFV